MKRLVILGSTGSIGTQTLEVARWREYEMVGLAAGKNAELLIEQVREFKPALVSCDAAIATQVRDALPAGTKLASSEEVAAMEAEVVVAAIPGIAGLKPTVAALEAGHQVALANKEAMVVAGPLVWQVARANGASITPMDSEHSALFQCLKGEDKSAVDKLVLTASGGPFRLQPEDLSTVTVAQALQHPNWVMGKKVTIDSATLFNKGLEALEAHFLFEIPLAGIEVVIHPQSLIHGLVRFCDGSIKAQIGPHDMRLPIQYSLEYPQRPPMPLAPLPLEGQWEFAKPDSRRFPALALAYEAGRLGGVAPAALNAADEVAVEAFLAGKIRFTEIPGVLEHALRHATPAELSWEAIAAADQEARRLARSYLGTGRTP
jgi:1-deoxy-D-xylulose-5-phosphate reductoisomerase